MNIKIKTQIETEQIAAQLAAHVRVGDVIALQGNLGVGKSVFARAFIRGLCGWDEEVPSPTFTLVQIYEAEIGEIYHFDLYRLERPEDSFELGIDEAFGEGISLIEWPAKLGPYLPWDCLNIEITHGKESETDRVLSVSSQGTWLERLKEVGLG